MIDDDRRYTKDELRAHLGVPLPPPAEPMSATLEAAVGLHELFQTYVAGGFTETQALCLLAQIIRPQQ